MTNNLKQVSFKTTNNNAQLLYKILNWTQAKDIKQLLNLDACFLVIEKPVIDYEIRIQKKQEEFAKLQEEWKKISPDPKKEVDWEKKKELDKIEEKLKDLNKEINKIKIEEITVIIPEEAKKALLGQIDRAVSKWVWRQELWNTLFFMGRLIVQHTCELYRSIENAELFVSEEKESEEPNKEEEKDNK